MNCNCEHEDVCYLRSEVEVSIPNEMIEVTEMHSMGRIHKKVEDVIIGLCKHRKPKKENV